MWNTKQVLWWQFMTNKSWGDDFLKSFYWIKERRVPQHSEGYLHIPLKPSHALQPASFQVITNYSDSLLKSRLRRIGLRCVTKTNCACKLCLFDQSQKLKQQHKKKAARPCARRENLRRQCRKYICVVLSCIFVRQRQSLRLFLVYD